jgi:PAS domain S-box-containing protein
MLGYTREEYIGRNIAEFHVDRAAMEEMLARLAAGESVRDNEAQLRCRDGSVRHVIINANVNWDGDRYVHARCFARDITDRKQAEEERQRFATLAESSRDFIAISDPDGAISYINPGGLTTVGLTEEEAHQTSIRDFFFPEDQAGVASEFLPRVIRDGAGQLEIRFRHFQTGDPIWMTFAVVALKDGTGTVTGLATVSRDITERKAMEEALREADRRKDEFLAVLAHELRNPLAPIRNSLHILRLTGNHDHIADRVSEMMERQVNHMVRLVDDLLEVSRITRGKIALRKELTAIDTVITTAIETSKPLIDAAGHQLTVALPSEPLVIEGDPVRLAQVLSNLINNAAKYTEPGGKIALTVEGDGESVLISVRDTGTGIPAEMLPRVFEPFTQIEGHLDRAQGGLGIGLTLVKSLVEMHGGTVTAQSEGPGRGSEFAVRLPVAGGTGTGAPGGLRPDHTWRRTENAGGRRQP